jgi:protein SCO1
VTPRPRAPERRSRFGSLGGAPALFVLVFVSLVCTGALAYALVAADGDEPVAIVKEQDGPFRGGQLPPELVGAPAPPFEHSDARGGRIGTASLAGTPFVVTFLFTDCPDVCPLIGQELREALEILGPRASDVAVLAVSVDPGGDTPAAARSWLAVHDLPRNFHYLVGSEDELAPTWEAYFAAPQRPGDPESTHTASMWLVDSDGRLRTRFSAAAPVAPADIAHDLGLLLDDVRRRRDAASG